MASKYHGKFEVSQSWVLELGLLDPGKLDADMFDNWFVVGFDRDLMERISQKWSLDVSHWSCHIHCYADAPTFEAALDELRHCLRSDYMMGIPFDYEIWHVVDTPDWVIEPESEPERFVDDDGRYVTFSDMDAVEEYVLTALGDWSRDFCVTGIAADIVEFDDGVFYLLDVPFWDICAANEFSVS